MGSGQWGSLSGSVSVLGRRHLQLWAVKRQSDGEWRMSADRRAEGHTGRPPLQSVAERLAIHRRHSQRAPTSILNATHARADFSVVGPQSQRGCVARHMGIQESLEKKTPETPEGVPKRAHGEEPLPRLLS